MRPTKEVFMPSAAAAVTFFALIASTALAAPPQIELPDALLRDKTRGGVIGKIYGDLNALPHEMKYIDAPGNVEHYPPSLPAGAWTDDDTDIEWVHLVYMDK